MVKDNSCLNCNPTPGAIIKIEDNKCISCGRGIGTAKQLFGNTGRRRIEDDQEIVNRLQGIFCINFNVELDQKCDCNCGLVHILAEDYFDLCKIKIWDYIGK